MRSLWSDEEAAAHADELSLRVYTSRLLGREPALVLHGGGNTSLKARRTNVLGEDEDVLYVKGSGHDLASIGADGFSPVRLERLLALATLDELSDSAMANELRCALVDAAAPEPSVEAVLHAALPFRFVDHTHADAVVSITNTPDGEARIRELYGDRVVVVPYVMPGFKLARLAPELYRREAGPETIGLLLLRHGVFSFGDTARESYERMIELVTLAEEYLAERGAWDVAPQDGAPPAGAARLELAALRAELSRVAGFPLVLTRRTDHAALAFARREDLPQLARQGPATPDHVIRTKRLPLLGRDVDAYAADYVEEFRRHDDGTLAMLDPAPRVVLDPALGLVAAGRTARDAATAADIYGQTIGVILRASRLSRYEALPASDVFEVEYWELEQAKLRRAAGRAPLAGEVALVTGAASGIGRGCVDALLARGAAVVGVDLKREVERLYERPDFLGVTGDAADERDVERALERAADAFGGLDLLVLNAGVFPPSRPIASLDPDEWGRTMRLNADAAALWLAAAHPLLRLAPRGGRVAVVASKNVPAPGPGAAAYSASKAALTQLARVAALEWGADGIRVNVVHPNAVFDTGLWSEEVLRARAEHYGVSVEEYRRSNVLRVEVTSRDVGEAVAELCGAAFAKTTGAQVPVDGGNERVI